LLNCEVKDFINHSTQPVLCGELAIVSKGAFTMKKYLWLFAGIAALILSTLIVLNVSAKSMADDCLPDGSCCEDVNNCTCN
jgi:hypothetical protein